MKEKKIVNLKKKIIVGVSDKTSNTDPEMGNKISKLWENFYQTGTQESIKNKVNTFGIGLYSDYENEELTTKGVPTGMYTITAGIEVSKNENEELTTKVIPAGRYAKFSIHGNMITAVADAWAEIWEMDLDRSFTGDFEEYLNLDFENADINIYVALK